MKLHSNLVQCQENKMKTANSEGNAPTGSAESRGSNVARGADNNSESVLGSVLLLRRASHQRQSRLVRSIHDHDGADRCDPNTQRSRRAREPISVLETHQGCVSTGFLPLSRHYVLAFAFAATFCFLRNSLMCSGSSITCSMTSA